MCTLSIFRKEAGYYVVMNRDERRDRLAERPPEPLRDGLLAPIDPASGGTWIALSQTGQWGALLNGYFDPPSPPAEGFTSRGTLLPDLLGGDDPFAAVRALDPARYDSFRLVIGSPDRLELWVYDGKDFGPGDFHARDGERRYFLTSSSWLQDEVIAARVLQFQDSCALADPEVGTVPGLHVSKAPDDERAILMQRSY
ncbi:MAG: NRDE family protein, partial [Pseudomonadota bacterium]